MAGFRKTYLLKLGENIYEECKYTAPEIYEEMIQIKFVELKGISMDICKLALAIYAKENNITDAPVIFWSKKES